MNPQLYAEDCTVEVIVRQPPVGWPLWRQAITGTLAADIPGTSLDQLANLGYVINGAIVKAWNGMAFDLDGPVTVAAGGHGDSDQNSALKCGLRVDAPVWACLRKMSDWQEHPLGGTSPIRGLSLPGANYPYTLPGAAEPVPVPSSRHTYHTQQYVRARNRVFLITGNAYWNNATQGKPYVDAFDMTTNSYDPQGTWPDIPVLPTTNAAICKHPDMEDIYVASFGVIQKWTQTTATWSRLTITGNPDFHYRGSLIDAGRGLWLQLFSSTEMRIINLATNKYTAAPVTGMEAFTATQLNHSHMVHDRDNDRYIWIGGNYIGQGTSNPDAKIYVINPTTYQATLLQSLPVNGTGIHNRFAWFDWLGGVVICPTFPGNLKFLPTRDTP